MDPINKKIPDIATPWQDYTGARVEEFIKEQLKARAGVFHYDRENSRYLVFSDAADRDAYLADPAKNESLLLGHFDAPSEYSAQINLITPFFSAVSKEQTGFYIEFTPEIKNKSGAPTGEDIAVVISFRSGASESKITQRVRHGATVRILADEYLRDGENAISIAITGQNTLAATTTALTVQVIDLRLSTSLAPGKILSQDTPLEIPFSLAGAGLKTVEFYIDADRVPASVVDDEVSASSADRVRVIPTDGLSPGIHSIQIRAYVTISGERFYTATIYREFALAPTGPEPLICLGADIPSGLPLVPAAQAPSIYAAEQYAPASVSFCVHNFKGAAATPVSIALDGAVIASVDARQDSPVDFRFTPSAAGQHSLAIRAGESSRTIDFNASQTSMDIAEISSGLVLDLRAAGRSNADAARDSWNFRDYSATLSGFDFSDQSGWVGSRLLFSPGASLQIPIAPLSPEPSVAGLTLELELATLNVRDDDAVIADIANPDGSGIILSATGLRLRSKGGKEIAARFKASENVRISVVINRKTGSQHRALAFIYLDAILSHAVDFDPSDSFLSDRSLTFSVSDSALLSLKEIKVYRAALSPDQILNNYILSRDSVDDMRRVYDRNNIYFPGTDSIDPDRCAAFIPVKIITGNIPAIEATTDKKLAIIADSDYTDMQSPELSFSLRKAQITGQGTSSMSYPKKNFREYSQKRPDTVLINSDGEISVSRLYAFTHDAAPVNCWCDKADYAESSGTHNTGIARLWNTLLVNTQVDGLFPLRTAAQQSAINSNYPYDVRTTVDGFPILMFYRQAATDSPVFIGKYNFNNDKSTESVFGFRDIPGFNSSKVQCWESLNNGHHLALFQDTEQWDSQWPDAFESRFPDGSTDTAALRRLASWLSTVSQEQFATQKFDYFDIPKLVSYYIYLMRFGAVDQAVKNSMLVTEDGIHWFFILYDNDTVLGLRNDGVRAYGPHITRDSLDESFTAEVYAFAGHDSRLWNLFEADTEIMTEILPKIDNALYVAGLSYESVIDMLDNKQAGAWCERVYNRDAQYKYLSPWIEKGLNYLFMLQGSRTHHRRWWLAERFSWLDAKWASAAYRANVIELKMAGAPSGISFSLTSAKDTFFGYGVNNIAISVGIHVSPGQSHKFTTKQVLNVGDPLRIYNAPSVSALSIGEFAPYLAGLNVAGVASDSLGSALTSLSLAHPDGSLNSSLNEISGLDSASALESLDISGFTALRSLPLDRLTKLRSLKASQSGLTAAAFAPGAPLDSVTLPLGIQSLSLVDLQYLGFDGISIPKGALRSLEIRRCPLLENSFAFLRSWILGAPDSSVLSIALEGVRWEGMSADDIISLFSRKFASLDITGTVSLTECTLDQGSRIMEIFGQHCFNAGAALRFLAPTQLYLTAPAAILSGDTARVSYEMFPPEDGTPSYEISPAVAGCYIDPDGTLHTDYSTSERTITIAADYTAADGTRYPRKQVRITVRARTAISSVSLSDAALIDTATVRVITSPALADIPFSTQWQLSGSDDVEILESDDHSCTIRKTSDISEGTVSLKAIVTDATGKTFNVSKSISILGPEILDDVTEIPASGVIHLKFQSDDGIIPFGIGWSGNRFADIRSASSGDFTTPDLPAGSSLFIYGLSKKLLQLSFDEAGGSHGLSGELDITNSPGITWFKAKSTSLSAVLFPQSTRSFSECRLPDSLVKFWPRNNKNFIHSTGGTDFEWSDHSNTREIIWSQYDTGYDGENTNCSRLIASILSEVLPTLDSPSEFRIHFADVWFEMEPEILLLLAQCSGISLSGIPEELPTVTGRAKTGNLSKADYDFIHSRLPDLDIRANAIIPEPDGSIQLSISPTYANRDQNVFDFDENSPDGTDIDWGDGTSSHFGGVGIVSHSFPHNGNFTVRISNTDDCRFSIYTKTFLKKIFSIGDCTWQFPTSYCEYLNSVPKDIFSNVDGTINVTELFKNCRWLKLDSKSLDPLPDAADGNFYWMFLNCENMTNVPDAAVDLIKRSAAIISDAEQIFGGCTRLEKIPDALFAGATKASTFAEAFVGCDAITSVPRNLFDGCVAAANFERCFYNCASLVTKHFPSAFKAGAKFTGLFHETPVGTLCVPHSVPPAIASNTLVPGDIIYVPDEAVDDYKAASIWSEHAGNIRPLSQYSGD